jgi:two-component system alkaline phosphatase synthesis response regulator PhoP
MSGILLVDDDEEMRRLWEIALTPMQLPIYHAENGVEALYQARQYQPDLVILDLMMPMASGDLVLGFLRSTDELKKTYVLVVSAHHNIAALAQQYEADGYLAKPVMLDDLRSAVRQLLGQPA